MVADGQVSQEVAEKYFPELKESEGEKIRKALIRFHKSTIDVDGIKGEDIIAWLEKQSEQKPAWSEEDEKEVAVLEAYIRNKDWSERHIDRALGIVDELVNKVKSLKPQPKQEWNEEDENRLQSCLNILQAKGIMGVTETINTKWLKSLKERIGG